MTSQTTSSPGTAVRGSRPELRSRMPVEGSTPSPLLDRDVCSVCLITGLRAEVSPRYGM
ncbi:hypothetical protein U9M48_023022 [Paspalum notatum var. saurae]|uniref:Uncharacterized protein n=1 Tax=Paspalum notatum var. saurae TaxID=547442 RepID=A0AAQ3WVH9_PASNO